MCRGEVIDQMPVVGDEQGLIGDAGAGGLFDDVAGAPLGGDDDDLGALFEKCVTELNLSAGAGDVGACFVGIGINNKGKALGVGVMGLEKCGALASAPPEGYTLAGHVEVGQFEHDHLARGIGHGGEGFGVAGVDGMRVAP